MSDELIMKIDKAHDVVSELCRGKIKWVMHVPARPDDDPDLVIGAALRASRIEILSLRSRVEELTAEVTYLTGKKQTIFELCKGTIERKKSKIVDAESRVTLLEGIVRELVEEGEKLHKQVTVDGWTYREWPEVVAKSKEVVNV